MTRPSISAQSSQDHPLEAVPESERQSTFSLSVVLFGFTFFSATMMAGGEIGAALGLGRDLFWAVLLGNLLLASYAAMLSVLASRTGLSTILMSKLCFGERGSVLSDILLGFTQVGWYAWGTDTMAQVIIKLLEWPQGFYWPLVLLFGFGFCLTAVIGYKGLQVLSTVMVPLMTLLIIWSGSLAWSQGASGTLAGGMSLAKAITIVIGTFVSGATQSTNWTRYAKSTSAAVGVSFLAFFIGNGLMVGYGALSGAVYSQADVVEVLALQGLASAALFMLLANIWTTQDNTIYNFSLAGCHLFRTDKRRRVTFIGACVGTILALFGFASLLVPFLLTLGTAVPPLGGVILGLSGGVGRTEKMLHWDALGAYLLGLAAALILPGVPPLNGVLVGAIAARYLASDPEQLRDS